MPPLRDRRQHTDGVDTGDPLAVGVVDDLHTTNDHVLAQERDEGVRVGAVLLEFGQLAPELLDHRVDLAHVGLADGAPEEGIDDQSRGIVDGLDVFLVLGVGSEFALAELLAHGARHTGLLIETKLAILGALRQGRPDQPEGDQEEQDKADRMGGHDATSKFECSVFSVQCSVFRAGPPE